MENTTYLEVKHFAEERNFKIKFQAISKKYPYFIFLVAEI